MQISVSAPGKLMLFGEHAVVYGHPCLVTAIDHRLSITVETIDAPVLMLEAGDVLTHPYTKPLEMLGKGDIPKGARFVEHALESVLPSRNMSGFKVTTHAMSTANLGLGSSSAVTVCVVAAVAWLLHRDLTKGEMFTLAHRAVLTVQGQGSGFDVAAAIYGGTLYFVASESEIEPLQIADLPLVIGYSGVKANTADMIHYVGKKFSHNQAEMQKIFSAMEEIVMTSREALLRGDWLEAGGLMNENHKLLKALGVSTTKLDAMVTAARKAGAAGAKLSGAGGGDCMVAIVEKDMAHVSRAIEESGGEVIDSRPNAEGVRIEL